MNILNKKIEQQPSVEMFSSQIVLNSQNYYKSLIKMYENSVNEVWNNPYYSASDIIASLGNDAAEVLTIQEKLAETLNGLVSGCAECKKSLYTKNEDGTVTLN